ncbi:MAG TPA: SRPBCC family protein [Actinobacteria bacterium]|nr:SRPBCC family protein [Actinomycetota bacterium]
MPSASFHHRVRLPVPPATVWRALQEPTTWEHVGPVERVWDPEFDGDVLVAYRWSTTVGGKVFDGRARTIEHREPDRFVVDLDGGEMGGVVTVDLTGDGAETTIDVGLEVRAQGLVSTLAFPAIRGAIASGFPDQVEELAERIAGG